MTDHDVKNDVTAANMERMKELVLRLNEARRSYEQYDTEIMSNYEYDKLYDELLLLEQELGMTLSQSPTVSVGYEVVSSLPKEEHEFPMLSLDKTKEPAALADFLGTHRGVLSWKLDGLTVVLTYREGALDKAVTRGDGQTGEVITPNARVFENVPLHIPYKGSLTVRGEAVIRYDDFEKINEKIEDVSARYKNPRNLCSGSVRQMNSEVTAQRHVRFYAFSMMQAEDVDFKNSRLVQFEWLARQGFETVDHRAVDAANVAGAVQDFAGRVTDLPVPSDGLVLVLDDIAYGLSLGRTAKFPRDSIAFKWSDTKKETTLRSILWSPSRTGLLNPVAIFEPVELEGTTVARASVHNLSILEELKLAVGDRITVYKANMIIPQIAENLTGTGPDDVPEHCPVCGHLTEIVHEAQTKVLCCPNPACPAKHSKLLTHFVSRSALNVDGLSEATLEKMMANGYIREPADIFLLKSYEEEICAMDGFGTRSAANLFDSIERARKTTLDRVIYSLGIPNVGLATARLICDYCHDDISAATSITAQELSGIDGIGPVIAGTYEAYFRDEDNRARFERLLSHLEIERRVRNTDEAGSLDGHIYVITGSLRHFSNRDELKSLLESRGAKVTGSVTKKTTALINNDQTSTSSKNKKAKELSVPILSEEELMEQLQLPGGGN